MARSASPSHAFRRTARRSLPLRFKPVAHAAVALAALWVGQPDALAGAPAVRLALPFVRPTSVDISGLRMPDVNKLPQTTVDLSKDNLAKSGNVTGVVTNGNTLTLTQTTSRAVVLFNSFDIGAKAVMNVDFGSTTNPGSAGWSSLFQVSNSTAPSQIYGSLNSAIVAADGSRTRGGEIFLINANGILFGRNASVNVGSLFASTLAVDEADYNAGLTNSINSANATFKWVSPDGIATYSPEHAFVKVDQDAQITTGSGGRVFLLGGQVENAGTIQTPNGQTVLAAGSSVFLSNPTDVDTGNKTSPTSLYLSEANANVPTVKGLLVEVDGQRVNNEFATNAASGTIRTPTGNATIVGWAVNQLGRVSATTSVTQNGSVYLLARSGAAGSSSSNTKLATVGGSLVLGSASTTEILPDATAAADGSPITAASNAVFTPSRVEMSAQSITLEGNGATGAKVVAPGGTVNVRASAVPAYLKLGVPDVGVMADGDTTGVVTVQNGASIDVSGTTDTTVSVARNFVTTALLGAQDLKDAPLQKDGPIYRSKLTFDIRSGSPILNDTSSYINGVQKTAGEFMAKGGNVVLSATGQVNVDAGARINASGGTVNFTSAWVSPSVLLGEDGKLYTLNTAPADIKYVDIGGQSESTSTRFGTQPAVLAAAGGKQQAGYTEGRDAGSVSVYAPVAHIDGQVRASTVVGERQKAGLDPLAAMGTLRMGTASNLSGINPLAIGAGEFGTTVMNELVITRDGATVDDRLSRIAASTLTSGGFGNVQLAANQGITQQGGANITLPDLSTISLQSLGQITLGGNITTHGGTITAGTYDTISHVSQGVTLQAGAVLDASGNWVNQRLDATPSAKAVAGGKVTLRSDHSLITEQGSRIDASGGATVSTAGTFSGTAGGSITLEGVNATVLNGSEVVNLQGEVQGYSLGNGGKLRIKAGSIVIDGKDRTLQSTGATALKIGSGFFSEGGFNAFDLDGRTSLTITEGTQITPVQAKWQAKAAGRNAATGSKVSAFMAVDNRAETVRKSVDVALASSGIEPGAGTLSMAQNAVLSSGPQATISLQAGRKLSIDGTVQTLGGNINAGMATKSEQTDDSSFLVQLGDHAKLDVSGGLVGTSLNNGRLNGQVLQGGNINVSVTRTNVQSDATIDVAAGAQLLADGGKGVLDVAREQGGTGAAYTRTLVASDGGSIVLQGGSGGMRLAGGLSAQGGNASANGGSLTVQLGNLSVKGSAASDASEMVLKVQAGADGAGQPTAGQATLSAAAVANGGFSTLNLAGLKAVNFTGGVDVDMSAHLLVDAPVLSGDGITNLRARSTVQLGNSQLLTSLPVASGGSGKLNVQSGMVELFGQQTTQGLGDVAIAATREVRLRGVAQSGVARSVGGFNTQANVSIQAAQITPSTATDYTIQTTGDVTFGAGQPKVAPVLSAQSALTVEARNIFQNGVLRAPFGKISLRASDQLVLGAGSETSVSGEGLLVPYGATTNAGSAWQYNGQTQSSLQGQAITLDAQGRNVEAKAGASLNLDGGGQLLAYEFVPGPGGSKDIFAGAANGAFAVVPTMGEYAPYDAQIMLGNGSVLTPNPSAGNVLSLGNTIQFGQGAMVPAGTYAILPARYALLPGAFLVTPTGSTTAVALGSTQTRSDGSQVVGAVRGTAGVGVAGNAVATAYTVRSAEQARRFSEVRGTDVDTYLTRQADLNDTSVGALTRDAGRLAISAAQLTFDARTLMKAASGGRGGQLDIAAPAIQIGGAAPASGTLHLSEQQINSIGATSVLIGGLRQDPDARGVQAVTGVADTITVQATPGQALQVPDLTLAAGCDTCTQSALTVAEGVRIEATAAGTGSTDAPALALSGDGALVRVSSGNNVVTTRSGASRQQGTLTLGQGLSIQGGTVVLDATATNTIASSLTRGSTIKADTLVLGASRIVTGNGEDKLDGETPLILSGALAEQLNATRALTLRSYSTFDMLGTSRVGSASTGSLSIDAPLLRLQGDAAQATLVAGQVNLRNSSGNNATGDVGNGSLTVQANGQQGGTGHITLGEGNVAVTGAQAVTLNAAGSIVAQGTGGLSVPGDLSLNAQSLTAKQGAQAQLAASGQLNLTATAPATPTAVATPGQGASVALSGARVMHDGVIDLPSGKLTVAADQDIVFTGASRTNLAGAVREIDGVTLTTMGGSLKATSANANINLAAGSVVDVSAARGSSTAGSMVFSAPNGDVNLQGRLVATSAAGQLGGSLSVDSVNAQNLSDIAARIAAEQSTTVGNFTRAISLRNRQGDQTLDQGTTLSAQHIELSADQGKLTLQGKLVAAADALTQLSGGVVQLNAGGDVVLDTTANIVAQSSTQGSGGTAGQVSLSSRTGTLRLSGGRIDTRDASGDATGSGTVSLRAARNGSDINIDAIGTQLSGVGAVNVEAYKAYSQSTLKDADITKMRTEATTYLANGNAATIASKLGAQQSGLAAKVNVRAGVEVNASGALTLNTTNLKSGVAMTTYSTAGQPTTNAPINLTIRAGGNLNVATSISEGFSSTTATGVPQAGLGGDIRLVGGADLGAANLMATRAFDDGGDLNIGGSSATNSVIVRSTTGNIHLAAGRDVNLLNAGAVVYTTGRTVTSTPGYTKPTGTGTSTLFTNTTQANPFLSGGGSIRIDAQRDVSWLQSGTQQAISDWAYRFKAKTTNLMSVWNRYDLFKQGVATMGGGDIAITAGRDAWHVNAVAASNGHVGTDGTQYTYGGGSVALQAGRDVVGGMVGASRNLTVVAGRSVTNTTSDNALADNGTPAHNLTVVLGDGSNRVLARDNLMIDAVTLQGWLPAVRQTTLVTQVPGVVHRPFDKATLEMASTAGDLAVQNTSNRSVVIPGTTTLSAAGGRLDVADISVQVAAPQTSLSLLARDDVTTGAITQVGADAAVNTLTATEGKSANNLVGAGSTPTRVASESGSVYYGALNLLTPLRMTAGKSIGVNPANPEMARLQFQHQLATDVSLIQAGRDINLGDAYGLDAHGPGDVIVVAGRHINLGKSAGISARGNLSNRNLPAGSANITVLDGVALSSTGDVGDAVAAGYPLLGGQGMGAYPLITLLQITGEDGRAYSAQQWLDKAQALAGDTAYQALAWAFVNHRDNAALSQADALTRVSQLSDALKVKLAGQVLAKVWTQKVDADKQAQTLLRLADGDLRVASALNRAASASDGDTLGNGSKAQALIEWVAARTGPAAGELTLAQAWQQFLAMPVAQQALLVTRTLTAEVASAIDQAASLSGAAREAAYTPAYDALTTVFNRTSGSTANVSLSSSQIKTLQNSAISIFTPNGGVNVGQLSADANAKTAADLGIVTAAGGNVNLMVRDDVAVNTSRIFTLVKGDEVIWSSLGNVDAGRGAKTVTSTPTPVYYLDGNGQLQVDVSSAISGSGISATGSAYIAAPKGEINAGDAGISATKGLALAAQLVRGADAIAAPVIRGTPPAPAVNMALQAPAPAPTAAGPSDNTNKEEAQKQRRKRRNLLLEFLGFGVEGT